MNRLETKLVKIGNTSIGHSNNVKIQSMCNIKTSKFEEVIKQILELEKLGCDIIRVSVMDDSDALAIKEIKKAIHIPLVADIHFDYRLALKAIENGVDKIRINPGNIGNIENVKKVVDACKEKHIPIRIGVNSGSLDKSIHDYSTHYTANALVESAKKHVKILENLDFHDIVISLKGSDVLTTIKAYEIASETFPYPLHLGITEAGTKEIGIIRSVSGLAPLLLKGIGDTIRISLSADPKEEVISAKRMLHDLGLYPNYPTLVACPTCGRTRVNVPGVADKVLKMLEEINNPITVAVMGCVVNGPGEAKNADIGIAGGNGEWILFKKGQVIATLKNDDDAIERLKIEINQ